VLHVRRREASKDGFGVSRALVERRVSFALQTSFSASQLDPQRLTAVGE